MPRKFKRKGRFWVYIVRCKDGTYYTGSTSNLKRRIAEHNEGKKGARYTRYKRPVKLVWSREYRQFKSAVKLEMIIKKLKRRRKELLVNGRRLDRVLR